MGPRATLIILTAINLLNYIDRWLISAVMPAMQVDLKMNNTTAGFVMSAFMLGYFITSPYFGYLTDRVNRVRLVIIGTGIWSGATMISGQATSALHMVLGRVSVGVGEASTVTAGQAIISDLFARKKRNQAIAFFIAAIPIGAGLGFEIGGALETHFGWRSAFFIAGVPGLLVALLLFFVKDPRRGQFDGKAAQRKPSTFVKDIKYLIKNPLYMNTVMGYAAFTFTVGGFASWAPTYLVSTKGVALSEADSMFGLITVATGTLGSIIGGYGAAWAIEYRHWGDRIFVVAGTAIAIPLVIAGFLSHDKNSFYIFMALGEFFLFLVQPPVNVMILESVAPALRGSALALSVFFIHLFGDLISPPLVGFIADQTDLKQAVLVLPAVLFFSLIFLARTLRLNPTH